MKTETKTPEIVLTNGHIRSSDFIDRINRRVIERFPLLPPTMKLVLKDICGRDFWNRLDTGEQIDAGSWMRHMVRTKMVPFEFAGKTSSNSNLYRLEQREFPLSVQGTKEGGPMAKDEVMMKK